MRHTARMRTSVSRYHRHRFPSEIISHCVWLYFRFALSFRDVEELMSSRGVSLTYETVREWSLKFGQTYASSLRRRSPRPGDQWHFQSFRAISSCFFVRLGGFPGAIRSRQVAHAEAVLVQDARGVVGALAGLAIRDDFAIARQLTEALAQLIQRYVRRAGYESQRAFV